MRGNGNWILIVLVVLLIGFGIYITWKKEDSQELGAQGAPKAQEGGPLKPDEIEIIEPADEPAFELGFGMGPGLYGSGRQTSEMIGN